MTCFAVASANKCDGYYSGEIIKAAQFISGFKMQYFLWLIRCVSVLLHWFGTTVTTAGRHFYGVDGLAVICLHMGGVLQNNAGLGLT